MLFDTTQATPSPTEISQMYSVSTRPPIERIELPNREPGPQRPSIQPAQSPAIHPAPESPRSEMLFMLSIQCMAMGMGLTCVGFAVRGVHNEQARTASNLLFGAATASAVVGLGSLGYVVGKFVKTRRAVGANGAGATTGIAAPGVSAAPDRAPPTSAENMV